MHLERAVALGILGLPDPYQPELAMALFADRDLRREIGATVMPLHPVPLDVELLARAAASPARVSIQGVPVHSLALRVALGWLAAEHEGIEAVRLGVPVVPESPVLFCAGLVARAGADEVWACLGQGRRWAALRSPGGAAPDDHSVPSWSWPQPASFTGQERAEMHTEVSALARPGQATVMISIPGIGLLELRAEQGERFGRAVSAAAAAAAAGIDAKQARAETRTHQP